MVRCSNTIFGILNFFTFLLSIPILVGGIWLATKTDTDCEKFLQWPIIFTGAFLMIVSLAGLVGVCCKVKWLLWVYLSVMLILILIFFCFTVFNIVVSRKGSGHAVSNRSYKEYRLEDYSDWFRRRVGNHWKQYKSCIKDAEDCKNLANGRAKESAEEFYRKHLSPIESGCCKPPTSCGYAYVNATYWRSSAKAANTSDSDCKRWSNNQDELCYECNSCKAGMLADWKGDWRNLVIGQIVELIVLVVVYSIGLCAFRNIKRQDIHGYKGHPEP